MLQKKGAGAGAGVRENLIHIEEDTVLYNTTLYCTILCSTVFYGKKILLCSM